MSPIVNAGDGGVFFDEMQATSDTANLISAQIDPSQPQIDVLSTHTNPLVPDRHLDAQLVNFDPDQFDLSDDSHLRRLLDALLGAGGIGGLRRQQQIARMSSTLSGTNWLDLDGFWGKIFALPRDPDFEALPANDDGSQFDSSTTVTDSQTWDSITSRDGRYRSRIEQLAKGFAAGATYNGIYLAATAILNCDVEVVESWMLADMMTQGTTLYSGNTWFAVKQQFGPNWGRMKGKSWATLSGTPSNIGDTPLGNRGEIIIVPGRTVSEAERWSLEHVLSLLIPAWCTISVAAQPFDAQTSVVLRDLEADSNAWQVTSQVNQEQSVVTGAINLYPGAGVLESVRPGFGAYTGEKWSYNSRVSAVTAYVLDTDGRMSYGQDYDSVVFSDGTHRDYVPTDAMADSRRATMARASADGVMTTSPYVAGRGT